MKDIYYHKLSRQKLDFPNQLGIVGHRNRCNSVKAEISDQIPRQLGSRGVQRIRVRLRTLESKLEAGRSGPQRPAALAAAREVGPRPDGGRPLRLQVGSGTLGKYGGGQHARDAPRKLRRVIGHWADGIEPRAGQEIHVETWREGSGALPVDGILSAQNQRSPRR